MLTYRNATVPFLYRGFLVPHWQPTVHPQDRRNSRITENSNMTTGQNNRRRDRKCDLSFFCLFFNPQKAKAKTFTDAF